MEQHRALWDESYRRTQRGGIRVFVAFLFLATIALIAWIPYSDRWSMSINLRSLLFAVHISWNSKAFCSKGQTAHARLLPPPSTCEEAGTLVRIAPAKKAWLEEVLWSICQLPIAQRGLVPAFRLRPNAFLVLLQRDQLAYPSPLSLLCCMPQDTRVQQWPQRSAHS